MAAAARSFATRGFDRATMNEIAEAAGYTAASLYTYFDGKQQILDGMLDDFTERMLATFGEANPRSLTGEQKLELLMSRQLRLLDEQREAMLVFAAERARASARKARGLVLYARNLERWLRKNLPASTLGRRSAADAAFLIVGIGHAAFLRWASEGGSSKLENRAADIVHLFLYGVCGGRRAEVVR